MRQLIFLRSKAICVTRIDRLLFCLAAVGAAAALFWGCTVGPDYVRPKAATSEAYKELAGWKEAEPGDEIQRGKWWEIFNDPELNALEEQVDISNENIAAAEAQFRQALALVQVARASYFPTVTGGASHSRSRSSANARGGSRSTGSNSTSISGAFGTPGQTSSDYSLPFSLSWELDLWGRVRRTVESNRASAQASAADLESARLSAQAQLAQNYFQLRTQDAQKQVLEDTVVAYRKFLDMTKNQYASGVAAKAAVLQAETQLKTTVAQAIDVGVQRAQLEHAIALLMGKPPSSLSIPYAPLASVPPELPAGVPSQLLERRPDIAAAERRVAAANAQIGVAMAAYFPTVTLTASGGFEGSTLANWLIWPSRFWAVGQSMSEIIFEGGLRRAQTNQARAAWEGSVATYRQTVLTGFQEVEDNLAALRILDEESRAQDEAVKAAKESVAYTTNQYQAGTVAYLDVLVAMVTAFNNERTAVTIRGNRMNDSVLLIKALGGGWNAAGLPSDKDIGGGVLPLVQ